MKKTEEQVPKALREVWQWKDAVYQEVKHLPLDAALAAMLDNAHATAERLRTEGLLGPHSATAMAADKCAEYRTQVQRRGKK